MSLASLRLLNLGGLTLLLCNTCVAEYAFWLTVNIRNSAMIVKEVTMLIAATAVTVGILDDVFADHARTFGQSLSFRHEVPRKWSIRVLPDTPGWDYPTPLNFA